MPLNTALAKSQKESKGITKGGPDTRPPLNYQQNPPESFIHPHTPSSSYELSPLCTLSSRALTGSSPNDDTGRPDQRDGRFCIRVQDCSQRPHFSSVHRRSSSNLNTPIRTAAITASRLDPIRTPTQRGIIRRWHDPTVAHSRQRRPPPTNGAAGFFDTSLSALHRHLHHNWLKPRRSSRAGRHRSVTRGAPPVAYPDHSQNTVQHREILHLHARNEVGNNPESELTDKTATTADQLSYVYPLNGGE